MASMNAPKKSTAARTLSQKKQTNSKARNTLKDRAANECASPMHATRKSHLPASTKQPRKHTQIIAKCNCGFSNNLYIRGEGIQGLSWDKGKLMKCTKDDEWVWETNTPFRHGQIKILINDSQFEQGDNHDIECGHSTSFSPCF